MHCGKDMKGHVLSTKASNVFRWLQTLLSVLLFSQRLGPDFSRLSCRHADPGARRLRVLLVVRQQHDLEEHRGLACANLSPASFAPADLPKHNFVLPNPRNFLDVKVQGSGGFTRRIRGFARANDARERFPPAHLPTQADTTARAAPHPAQPAAD